MEEDNECYDFDMPGFNGPPGGGNPPKIENEEEMHYGKPTEEALREMLKLGDRETLAQNIFWALNIDQNKIPEEGYAALNDFYIEFEDGTVDFSDIKFKAGESLQSEVMGVLEQKINSKLSKYSSPVKEMRGYVIYHDKEGNEKNHSTVQLSF